MKRSRDHDIRPMLLPNVRQRRFNRVICTQLSPPKHQSEPATRSPRHTHRVDLQHRSKGILGNILNRGQKITRRTYPSESNQTVRIQRGGRESDLPQITKSIRPNLESVVSTAARSCSGFRTSACAGRHVRPVEEDNSRADAVTRSRLETENR